jgi:hypothetical protein
MRDATVTRRGLWLRLLVGAAVSVALAAGVAFTVTLHQRQEVAADLVSPEIALFEVTKENERQALSIGSGILRRSTEVRLGSRSLSKPGETKLNQLELLPPRDVRCRGLDLALRYEGGAPVQWALEIRPLRRSGEHVPPGGDPNCSWTLHARRDGDRFSDDLDVAGGPIALIFERPDEREVILGVAMATEIKNGPLLLRRPTGAHPQLVGPDGARGSIRMNQLSAEEVLDEHGKALFDEDGKPRPALAAELLVSPSSAVVVNGSGLRSLWFVAWVSLFAFIAVALFGIILNVLGLLERAPASPLSATQAEKQTEAQTERKAAGQT